MNWRNDLQLKHNIFITILEFYVKRNQQRNSFEGKNIRHFYLCFKYVFFFTKKKFHITHTQFNLGFSCLEHCLKL